MYTALKHLHITTVYITLALFLLRGFWMLAAPARLDRRWVRIVPHLNDTVLLATAIGLVYMAWGNPLLQPWLMAKIAGLLAYIVLGSLALRRAPSRTGRLKAFIAALAVFAYIIAVAASKQVIPGLI